MFELRRREVREDWKNCIMNNFITMMKSRRVRWGRACSSHEIYEKKMHTTEFCSENFLGDLGISDKIKAIDLRMRTGFIWLGI
jgi:hypothetical protein